MKRWTWLFLGLLFIVTGCQTVPDESETDSGLQLLTATSTPQRVMPTSSATSIPTAAPTFRPSLTPRPTHTPRPPTVTPLPTVPPADVPEFVQNLFETNAGCQLPCWWGIVPGQTTWADAWNFLSTFADERTVGGVGQQRAAHSITIPRPDGADSDEKPSEFWQVFIVSSSSGNVLMIRVGFGAERYPLPEVLAAFGPPDEVWIGTTKIGISSHPFYVVVSWPSQGIIVQYLVSASQPEDLLIGCPQYMDEEPLVPELWLMSPEEDDTFFEILGIFGFGREGARNFRPLEEATGTDVETFYEIFKNPNNTECLTTPLNLWPDYWP
jgi:hypothetical protein